MKKNKGDLKAAIFDIYFCKHCNVIHTPGLEKKREAREKHERPS